MEKRQLDFSAPLLSARRLSSPRKSSELVHRKSVEKRVPPDGPTKPAAVPFNWEQTPGRAKNEPKPKPRFPTTTTTPRLPPGWVHSGEAKFDRGPTNPTIYSDHASLIEKLDESLKCKDESENSDAENVEETYSDAINALSLNDSCSVSGVSGNHGASGRFSVDKQTRDFMMSRFLPAAKAVVVLETPQYAAKKPAVVGPTDEGAVKEVKKKVVYGSSGILRPYGTDDFDGGESEDEEEDGERGTLVRVKKAAGKSWGIIPRICVKRSLCLLKPIPAMKSSSRHPTPTAGEERRLRRNPSGPLDKNGLQLHPPPKKYHSGLLSHDHRGAHNNSKPSSHDSYPLLSQPSSHESPLRRYRSRSVSPYRNESPRGIPKKIDTEIASSRKMFNALLDVSHRNQATVEKTLYVDSANKTAAQNVRTSSKYADEVKDVKKYLSGGVGLGVKEEMEGFGGSCGPVPPPLPKSPSESWLWRTLPFGQSRRHLSRDGIR